MQRFAPPGAGFSPRLFSPGSEAKPQANFLSQQRDSSLCATSILGENSKENSPHWVFQLRPRRRPGLEVEASWCAPVFGNPASHSSRREKERFQSRQVVCSSPS